MKSANRVFKNTMFLYIRMGITVLSSLYATRLILNALGASDFGIFNLVGGLISMLIFLNSAMTQASQRFMSYSQGKGEKTEQAGIFSVSFVLHLAVAILSVALLKVAESFLFEHVLKIDLNRIDSAKMIYQFMIVSSFFVIISVPFDAVINAHENMLFVAILGVIESLLKLGIAILITISNSDRLILYGFLIALLSMSIMIMKAVYTYLNYEEVQVNIRKNFNKSLFGKMMNFVGYTLLGSTTSIITNYGTGLVLNTFFGTIVNAAQGIATQISAQLGVFARVMLQALSPMITKSAGAGNKQLMLDASFVGGKISFFLLIFFYVPIIFEMPLIFKYWLVNIPEYTIIFCKLLFFRNLIEQLYLTLATSIISVGKIKRFQLFNSILNLLPLPAAYLLFKLALPPYMIYVVFIFYSLSQCCAYVYFAKKECDMSIREYINKVVLKSIIPFLIILIIVAIPHILMEDGLLRLFVVILTNTVSYLFVIWFIGLTDLERLFIVQIIKKVRAKVRI